MADVGPVSRLFEGNVLHALRFALAEHPAVPPSAPVSAVAVLTAPDEWAWHHELPPLAPHPLVAARNVAVPSGRLIYVLRRVGGAHFLEVYTDARESELVFVGHLATEDQLVELTVGMPDELFDDAFRAFVGAVELPRAELSFDPLTS